MILKHKEAYPRLPKRKETKLKKIIYNQFQKREEKMKWQGFIAFSSPTGNKFPKFFGELENILQKLIIM